MKTYFVETEENRKKYIKQENKLIVLALVSIYGFNVLASNLNNILKRFDKRDSVDDMKTSISDNTNINEEEKKYLNGIDVFINDYEKYIDVPFACYNLENFDILYKDCREKGSVVTKGSWSKSRGEIIYYITDDEDDEKRQKVINHELLHLISSHEENYPGILNEGVTSVICYEYNLNTDSYDKYRLITYMLCEIVSSNTVIESYLKSDYSLIENKLYEIIPDKNLISMLSDRFDDCEEYTSRTKEMLGIELDEDEQEEFTKYEKKLNKSLEEISKILCAFYMTKTGKFIGDSNSVNDIFDGKSGYEDFDLKMSIFNTELTKKTYYYTDKYDQSTGKIISTKRKIDNFCFTTDYFNKRNKDKIYFSDDIWGFSIDPKDGVLKSDSFKKSEENRMNWTRKPIDEKFLIKK